MKIIGIIPSRMASTRFPGKPLTKIKNVTMIEHVYRRSMMSKLLSDLYVATCDPEIEKAVKAFGGKVVMTAATHTRCTDRVAEAVQNLDADVVINIQGDEPLLHPSMLDAVAQPFIDDATVQCTTLMKQIDEESVNNTNVVKVVFDKFFNALYFSREPIPTFRMKVKKPVYKQIGILAFKRQYLIDLSRLPETPLEQAESVDLMRCLENGHKVRVVDSPYESIGVDRPEDVPSVEKLLEKDSLFPLYANGAPAGR